MGPGNRGVPAAFLGHGGSWPSTPFQAAVPAPMGPCPSRPSQPFLLLLWCRLGMRHSRVFAVPAGNPAPLSVHLHPLPHLLLSANTLRPACLNLLYTVGFPIDCFISYVCSQETPGAVSFPLACVLRQAGWTVQLGAELLGMPAC